MIFRTKKHAERFFAALADKRIGTEDRGLMAAIYLLTSQKRIWNEFAHFVDSKNGIDPEAFHLYEPKNQVDEALVTAAYDLIYCSDMINLTDLTDRDTIPDKAFMCICQTIGYSLLNWIYSAVFGALATFFEAINNFGAEIFDLKWIQDAISLFEKFGWGLFVVGVVVGSYGIFPYSFIECIGKSLIISLPLLREDHLFIPKILLVIRIKSHKISLARIYISSSVQLFKKTGRVFDHSSGR